MNLEIVKKNEFKFIPKKYKKKKYKQSLIYVLFSF